MRAAFIIAMAIGLAAPALAQRETISKPVHVAELTNRAADLIDQKQYARAEQVLNEALSLEPNDLTALYDLACAIAGQGDLTRALTTLQRANAAGFSDFAQVGHDPALASVRELPAYQQGFVPPEAAIHRAAQFHINQLQGSLGSEYTVVADEPNRLIFAVRERSASLADLRHTAKNLLDHECTMLFHNRPQQFVRIIVASVVDYARLETRSEVRGSYDDATRTVLVKETGPELRHELTHALHAADQHAHGMQHPVWVVEGLAVAFEFGDDTADNWRLTNVQSALRSNSLIPLSTLIKMPRSMFQQRSDLAYGEAGSLIVYLHDRQLLARFYTSLNAGHTGKRALEMVTGNRIEAIESDWRDWVAHRVAPSRLNRAPTSQLERRDF